MAARPQRGLGVVFAKGGNDKLTIRRTRIVSQNRAIRSNSSPPGTAAVGFPLLSLAHSPPTAGRAVIGYKYVSYSDNMLKIRETEYFASWFKNLHDGGHGHKSDYVLEDFHLGMPEIANQTDIDLVKKLAELPLEVKEWKP